MEWIFILEKSMIPGVEKTEFWVKESKEKLF